MRGLLGGLVGLFLCSEVTVAGGPRQSWFLSVCVLQGQILNCPVAQPLTWWMFDPWQGNRLFGCIPLEHEMLLGTNEIPKGCPELHCRMPPPNNPCSTGSGLQGNTALKGQTQQPPSRVKFLGCPWTLFPHFLILLSCLIPLSCLILHIKGHVESYTLCVLKNSEHGCW